MKGSLAQLRRLSFPVSRRGGRGISGESSSRLGNPPHLEAAAWPFLVNVRLILVWTDVEAVPDAALSSSSDQIEGDGRGRRTSSGPV